MERTDHPLSLIVVIMMLVHCCLLIGSSVMAATITNISTDQSALLALKAHITRDPNNVLAKNWSSSSTTPVCNWVGVTCGSSHLRVTVLDLSFMNLTGTIPPHLGNLSFLVELHFHNNSFHGSLPHELARLRRLKLISFGYNNLEGEIPSFLGSLPYLESLYLYNNQFKGPIPSSIFNSSSLQVLHLSDNPLSGPIPNEIGDLQNLEVLGLDGNNCNGLLPSTLFNISTVRLIAITNNELQGSLPLSTGLWVPNLEILAIGGNQLSGRIPNSISNASKLTDLEVAYNSFSGPIPYTLGTLKGLKLLNFAHNQLSAKSSTPETNFLNSLTNWKSLRLLDFSDNPLDVIFPNSIGNISTSLQSFILRNGKVGGNIPQDIGNLSSLTVLDLGFNELTGTIPTTIGNLRQLQGLYLRNNNLQGTIPYGLCQLESMVDLYLDDNNLYGPIPSCLGNLTSLRKLSLGSNNLTSTIPTTLWSLSYMLHVNMSSNSLRGSISSDVGNLKVVTMVDFSNNQFSGNVPSSIGSLEDLVNLSLAHNELEGPIPESFGKLISLEFLDLSENNLSGTIPKSLEAASYLKYLNMSFNRLHGEIPNGGRFAKFSAQSFTGNEALCGAPRLQVPPCKNATLPHSRNRVGRIVLKYVLPAIASILFILVLLLLLIRYRKGQKKPTTETDSLPLATWRRFSYNELVQATQGFSESNLLGTGSFGSVYKGTLSDGTIVAVKVFNMQLEGAFKSFDAECEVLCKIRHRNLIKVISSCSNGLDFGALVLEYMPHGSLDKCLYSRNCGLNIPQRLNIMTDVASALEYLHHSLSTPIVHCDLKPNNILLDEDMVARVADFGIAKLLNGGDSITQTMTLATIGYMAPEYGFEGIVSKRGDVYSYGILLLETFTRKKPTDEIFAEEVNLRNWVKGSFPHALLEVIDPNLLSAENGQFSITKECLTSIIGLALDCTVESPEERINMNDVLPALKRIKTKLEKDVAQA
ncbi:receptor kinase-like protein Xa21 [Juglans microcarpa x Juglans regia]|uniref:receptor kinase-like protein Xa21 n=1 Tax=Juglans microcarpa x Juglans regia TaxID=2249226 RepID=UPI001B7F1874|nr:receptor kinase-like protein Xa21 [Juglans microcarpa x Juglans regia]